MMFNSYILDKAGFALLYSMCGGAADSLPEKLRFTADESGWQQAADRLVSQGYLHMTDNRTDVERTIDFLVSEMTEAKEVTEEAEGRFLFKSRKLYIMVEEDRISPKKCRLIPLKDDAMLEQYRSEYSSSDYEEEDDGQEERE